MFKISHETSGELKMVDSKYIKFDFGSSRPPHSFAIKANNKKGSPLFIEKNFLILIFS